MIQKENIGYHCFITNLTNHKVSIGDLNFSINPNSTIDILNCKHSHLTINEVINSLNNGDLLLRKEQEKISIRQIEPTRQNARTIDVSKASFPNKCRTAIRVEEKYYKELDVHNTINDEYAFAEQNADMAEQERNPNSIINNENKEE